MRESFESALEVLRSPCESGLDPGGIRAIGASQDLVVGRFDLVPVRVDVVQGATNLVKGEIEFDGDLLGTVTDAESIHDPVDGDTSPANLRPPAPVDAVGVHGHRLLRNRSNPRHETSLSGGKGEQ